MENPNKCVLNKAFQKYGVYTFTELSKKTGIHYMTLSRMFNDNAHKVISPAFKLVLDNIPPQELHSFLQELYTYYYNCENNDVVL
jgi:hypothetical protein